MLTETGDKICRKKIPKSTDRDYGKYFNINYMLDKDIIRRRLDEGITYTEFSYMILQATDFKYLHRFLWRKDQICVYL